MIQMLKRAGAIAAAMLVVVLCAAPVLADDAYDDETAAYINPYPLVMGVEVYDGVTYDFSFHLPQYYDIRANIGYRDGYFISGYYTANCLHVMSNVSTGALSSPVFPDLEDAFTQDLNVRAVSPFLYDIDWTVYPVFKTSHEFHYEVTYSFVDSGTYEYVSGVYSDIITASEAQAGYNLFPSELKGRFADALNGVVLITELHTWSYSQSVNLDGSTDYGVTMFNLDDLDSSSLPAVQDAWKFAIQTMSDRQYDKGFYAGGGAPNLFSWLIAPIEAFFEIEFYPGISIGGIAGIMLAVMVVIAMLFFFKGK